MKGQIPAAGDIEQPPETDEYAIDENMTSEQRSAVMRRLKPHSRINPMAGREKPEMMTPLPPREAVKKTKPTKWQFGIRSRNSPSEAMLAIFKALKAMGAVWETTRHRRPGRSGKGDDDSPDRDRRSSRKQEREGSQSPEYSDSDPASGTDPEYATPEERNRRNSRPNGDGSKNTPASSDDAMGPDSSSSHHSRSSSHHHSGSHKNSKGRNQRGRERHGPWNDWGYQIPEDPWVIHARFRKDGMFPPGVAHPSSAYSSRVDLNEAGRRRSSTMGSSTSLNTSPNASTPPLHNISSSHGSAHASAENVHVGSAGAAVGSVGSVGGGSLRRSLGGHVPNPDESAWVYVTIQLYCIEADSFMVDFKCAGYERLVRRLRREVRHHSSSSEGGDDATEDKEKDEWRAEGSDVDDEDLDEGYMGAGRVLDEKDISSPFPFMDVAASLIVQLAQGS